MIGGSKRGDDSRRKDREDYIVKVTLPDRDRVNMPRDDHGNVMATAGSMGRYLNTVQPISRPVLEECIQNGGKAYYIADYSDLLKMCIIDYQVKDQKW